jgi:hypothetical protein
MVRNTRKYTVLLMANNTVCYQKQIYGSTPGQQFPGTTIIRPSEPDILHDYTTNEFANVVLI